jgi:hypothetical protein
VAELPAVRDADPLAGAVAVYAGALGWKAGKLLPWLALIPVAFLELGSALAVVVVHSVEPRGSAAGHRDAGVLDAPAEQPAAPAAAGVQSPEAEGRRRKGGDDDTGHSGIAATGRRVMPANVVDLLRERGGKLEAGQRTIGNCWACLRAELIRCCTSWPKPGRSYWTRAAQALA